MTIIKMILFNLDKLLRASKEVQDRYTSTTSVPLAPAPRSDVRCAASTPSVSVAESISGANERAGVGECRVAIGSRRVRVPTSDLRLVPTRASPRRARTDARRYATGYATPGVVFTVHTGVVFLKDDRA